ncbi:hypothetical protein L1987_79417 [Smallanthus sonchifolius]|uniref:Uncharacterized protein n=1 Tax=Smallanthus sonchifolius TaxID=185202 RepID=A0ACB8ZFL2_9ASTR|nr:hypothetical protein L1987_79417 [Smallanthus sonchifolius]
MEMYANASSFTTSLTLQTPNSSQDVSFSSYLNKAEENMIRKLTIQASDLANNHHYRNGSEEDEEEIGVFGAEKYFKGEIEDVEKRNNQRIVENIEDVHQSFHVKVRSGEANMHTPSVRSNVSCNSRVRLLPRPKQAHGAIERGGKTRTFLANFGCDCMNKKSTQISEKNLIQGKQVLKPHARMLDFDQCIQNQTAERKTRNDYFSFPVLNSNDLNSNSSPNSNSNSKSGNLAGKVVGDNNGTRLSLGRKLSLLNDWDVDIPTEDEMYFPSSGMYNHDVDSDSSSDLFEIESFSTTGNNSFIAARKSESNCYEPSEVSVDWSVVTASAADFSVVSDYEEVRTGGGGWRISGGNEEEQKKRSGILSGCTSHRAVRVAGDEYKVSGGGAGGRRRLSESMAVGSLFRGGMI